VDLGQRLQGILDGLPDDWAEARLVLTVADPADADRAALMLASLGPGRTGSAFRLTVTRSGLEGASAEAVSRVLERLDENGIDARLTLPGTAAFRVAPRASEPAFVALGERWDALLADLPPDWSDLYLEVELGSSDEIERAALLMAPANPFLVEGVRPCLRFRTARHTGYGVAPAMARRVLARLDEEQILGTLHLLRLQSETSHVLTQGPVWRDAGRAV
jgi:hypothetical protein